MVQERLDAEVAERTAAEQQAAALKQAADSESAAALEAMGRALADATAAAAAAQQDAEQATGQLEARQQEVGRGAWRASEPVLAKSCEAASNLLAEVCIYFAFMWPISAPQMHIC